MNVFKSFEQLPKSSCPAVFSIGMFDGIHLGHQTIIKQLHKKAGSGLKGVITFDRRPALYFDPLNADLPIMTLDHRLALLEKYGLDFVICLSFNAQIAEMSFETFLGNIMDKVPIKHLILGKEACFGKKRGGNETTLLPFGKEHGFDTTFLSKLSCQKEMVSSTLLRHYVKLGDLKKLKKLMGRRYSLFTPHFEPGSITQKGRWMMFQLVFDNLTSLPAGSYTVSIESGDSSATGFALVEKEHGPVHKKCIVDVFFSGARLQTGPLTLQFIDKNPPKAQNIPLNQFEHLPSSLMLQTSANHITTKES